MKTKQRMRIHQYLLIHSLITGLNILFSIKTSLNLIRDTVTRNKKQAAVIINNGISILTSILGAENFEIEAG